MDLNKEWIDLVIDINKAIVNISRTLESTNSSISTLAEASKAQGENITELNTQICNLQDLHQEAISKVEDLKGAVTQLNKRFEVLTTQMDFKEKINSVKPKSGKFSLTDIFLWLGKFFLKWFPWVVVLVFVVLIAFGVLQPDVIINILKPMGK